MSLSPIPRSVEDEEESVMGGLGLIYAIEKILVEYDTHLEVVVRQVSVVAVLKSLDINIGLYKQLAYCS